LPDLVESTFSRAAAVEAFTAGFLCFDHATDVRTVNAPTMVAAHAQGTERREASLAFEIWTALEAARATSMKVVQHRKLVSSLD